MNVLIYHTLEDALCGAELVLIHMMKYFLTDPNNTVTVVGFKAPDLKKFEFFSGIALPQDRIFSVQPDMPAWLKLLPGKSYLIKTALLCKKARDIAKDYDLCISSCNEIDFGRRGVQYIHAPNYASFDILRKYRLIHEKSVLNRYPRLSPYYIALTKLIAGNKSRMEKNYSITNSRFMQGVIGEVYDINADIIYPSLFDFSALKPEKGGERAMRMVCLGRIASDKNTLGMVDMYAAIHKRVPHMELVIAGNIMDPDYYDVVRVRAAETGTPITFMTNIPRTDLETLLKTSLFFINPKYCEHFGIATLEAMTAGCLPMVHQSGGSVEIVPTPELQFQTTDDLVAKVERLVAEPALRASLLDTLENHLPNFSIEKFYQELDQSVTRFMAEEKTSKTDNSDPVADVFEPVQIAA